MKIQIGKFTGEIDEAVEGLPGILEGVTNLLVAEGWHPQTIYDCMGEELERIANMFNVDSNDDEQA